MLSGDQKLDLRNVCDFSGGAYRFEFSCQIVKLLEASKIAVRLVVCYVSAKLTVIMHPMRYFHS